MILRKGNVRGRLGWTVTQYTHRFGQSSMDADVCIKTKLNKVTG